MKREVVVRLENVTKRYNRAFGSLRHLVQESALRLMGRPRPEMSDEQYIWALREVSFEARRGEILGIIGRNGAGKSTILKLISRITYPSSGLVAVRGQARALIEVGAGFHPELSGRENVYLNGSILGMSRREVKEKYESIVEFAELERFMEMPVKRYSSGMYVRLGFSVAAHLEPDILLVDEVLAVGDAGFQAKCVNKVHELKERATSIILVSHNMTNVARHSDRVLWMDNGQIRASGATDEVIGSYLEWEKKKAMAGATLGEARMLGGGTLSIESVFMTKADGSEAWEFEMGEVAQVHINYHAEAPVRDPVFSVNVLDETGRYLSSMTTKYDGLVMEKIEGRGSVVFQFDPLIMLRGSYYVHVAIRDGASMNYLVHYTRAASFLVRGPSLTNKLISGEFNLPHKWHLRGPS